MVGDFSLDCGDMVNEEQLWPFFIEVDKDGESLILRRFGNENHGERTLVMVKVTPRRISPEDDQSRDPPNWSRPMVDYAEILPTIGPTTTRKRSSKLQYQND